MKKQVKRVKKQNAVSKQKRVDQSINALLQRAASIQTELDRVKPLYGELDQLISELIPVVGRTFMVEVPLERSALSAQHDAHRVRNLTQYTIEVIDNYAYKNTAFKTVALRRYDLKMKRVN